MGLTAMAAAGLVLMGLTDQAATTHYFTEQYTNDGLCNSNLLRPFSDFTMVLPMVALPSRLPWPGESECVWRRQPNKPTFVDPCDFYNAIRKHPTGCRRCTTRDFCRAKVGAKSPHTAGEDATACAVLFGFPDSCSCALPCLQKRLNCLFAH